MNTLSATNLTKCHICFARLIPHPLYKESGTKYCPDDGDFFVQKLRGQEPTVTFKPFDKPTIRISRTTIRFQRQNGGCPVKIKCEQTGVVYPSLKNAASEMGISKSSLSMHMNGRRKNVEGYTFVVEDPS